jgi:hypothetical protein
MKPEHKEFFRKLGELCKEYSASLGGADNCLLGIYVGHSRYKTGWFDGDTSTPLHITELVNHRIESEEPKP